MLEIHTDERSSSSFRFRAAMIAAGAVVTLAVTACLVAAFETRATDTIPSPPSADIAGLFGHSTLAFQKPGSNAPATPAPKAKTPPKPLPQVEAKPVVETQGKDEVAPAAAPLTDEKLFEKWPEEKPQTAILITGNTHGYLEPCGCAGLENQKGGYARRHTFFKSLAAKGWNLVPIDAGNHIRRQVTQSELKFSAAAAGLRTMNYQSIGMGNEDLRLPSTSLINEFFLAQPPDFVCANACVLDETLSARWRTVKSGGRTIGITQVLSDEFKAKIPPGDVKFSEARPALIKALTEMRIDKPDYVVVVFFGDEKLAKALIKDLGTVDLLVAAGEPGEPQATLEKVEGHPKAKFLRTGDKGSHVSVVGLTKNGVHFQRVPLDSRWDDSKDMLELMKTYQDQLKAAGLEGLGVREQPHPTGARFVGSEACGTCHTKAFAHWRGTPHAHATESLIHPPGDRPARHFDPECLGCHVTGWNPALEKWYPYESGYLSLEQTPHLRENGCENCHGPGSEHVKAESDGAAEDVLAKLRNSMKLPLAGKVAEHKCMECHDGDNSPEFKFDKYWEEVKHEGKD